MERTTSHIAPYLLEQCNARHECNVSIKSDKCVQVVYWCNIDIPSLEVSKSLSLQIKDKQRAIGLMSEGYKRGAYQRARNITCNVSFASPGNHSENQSGSMKEIYLLLYDFASFTNSSEFCLTIKNSEVPPYCSGSQTYYTGYRHNIIAEREFSVSLASTEPNQIQIPPVRFWFDMQVETKGVYLDQIECHSQPEYENPISKKTNAATTFIISVSVVGTVLFLAMVTLIVVAVRWFIHSKCHCSKNSIKTDEYAEIADENHYTYIDLDTLGMAVQQIREEEVGQNIPNATEESQGLCLASEGTEDATTEEAMPMQLEMSTPNSISSSGTSSECESKQSGESQEPRDYLDLIGDPDYLEPVNTVNAEVHAPAGQTDSDEPANEYTSLSAMDSVSDGASNDSENAYCRLHNMKSENNDRRGERNSNTSQEPHDYLELIGDPERLDNAETQAYAENEYTSLSTMAVSGEANNNIENVYTALSDTKTQ